MMIAVYHPTNNNRINQEGQHNSAALPAPQVVTTSRIFSRLKVPYRFRL